MATKRGTARLRIEALETRRLLSAGSLDVVFGAGGLATTSSLASAGVHALAVRPDGRTIVVGEAGAATTGFALARYNLDGSLDASFGNAGLVTTAVTPGQNSVARGVVLQQDGKIVVVGVGGASGSTEFALARYNADGSLDGSFGTGGIVLTAFAGNAGATSVALTATGQIVVAGSVQPNPASSASDFAVARYNGNGSLDGSFGTGGEVTTAFGPFDAAATAVLVEANGTIVAAGHTSTSSGFFNFGLARYLPNGTLDPTFNHTGTVTTNFGLLDDVGGLVLQPDGKLVAAGSSDINGKVVVALARYNSDGSLDAGFGMAGKVTTDFGGLNQAAKSILLQADGSLLVAGAYEPSGPSQFLLARYTSSGALDPTFGAGGHVFTPFGTANNATAAALGQLPDGTLIVAGTSGSSFALARYWGDNSPPDYAIVSPQAIYVNQLYEDLLGRPADSTGIAAWTGLLAQGSTRAQVAAGIQSSQEYRTLVVEHLYQTLLGRSVDPVGLQAWVGALAMETVEQVTAAILGSAEFFQDAGGSITGFLSALYQGALGRPIDPTGETAWTNALANGASRATVALQILTSPEAETDLVQRDYMQFLHRPADPVGLSVWTAELAQGQSDQAILAAIAGSDEFFSRL